MFHKVPVSQSSGAARGMRLKCSLRKRVQLAGGRILFNLVIPRICVKLGIPVTEPSKLLPRKPGHLNFDLLDVAHTAEDYQRAGLAANTPRNHPTSPNSSPAPSARPHQPSSSSNSLTCSAACAAERHRPHSTSPWLALWTSIHCSGFPFPRQRGAGTHKVPNAHGGAHDSSGRRKKAPPSALWAACTRHILVARPAGSIRCKHRPSCRCFPAGGGSETITAPNHRQQRESRRQIEPVQQPPLAAEDREQRAIDESRGNRHAG